MPSAKLIVGFTTFATILMAPGLGRAQTCNTDADCGKGLSCQTDTTATTSPTICTNGDAGSICVSPPIGASPMTCQLAACASAADCATDMVCKTQPNSTCTGTAPVPVKCDPTTGCDAGEITPEPVICTDTTLRCAYKWQQPCNVDADCGDGFTCHPSVIQTCSGSSGTATPGSTGSASAGTGGASGSGSESVPTPPPADIDALPPEPVSCTTTTSYCQPTATTCTVDSDCPSAWTCVASTVGTTVSGGTAVASDPGTAGGSTPVSVADGGAPVAVPPPDPTVVLTCQPPPSATRGYGTPVAVDTPKTGGASSASVDAGEAQGSTTPPSPAAPSANGGSSTTTNQTAATTGGGGGCSLGAGQPSRGPALLVGLLAMLGLALGRRERKS